MEGGVLMGHYSSRQHYFACYYFPFILVQTAHHRGLHEFADSVNPK